MSWFHPLFTVLAVTYSLRVFSQVGSGEEHEDGERGEIFYQHIKVPRILALPSVE